MLRIHCSLGSMWVSLVLIASLLLIISPDGSIFVLAQTNTTNTSTTTGGRGDSSTTITITDDDFVNIEDDIPQNVNEVHFPPEYTPCRSVPLTKFTIRTSDSVEVLSYPANIVTVSVVNETILMLDYADNLSVVDNTTLTGVIIAFPANQLKKIGTVERQQQVHVQDGFTSLTTLSEVNTEGILTATFTQLLDIDSGGTGPITGLSATTNGNAIVSSNVGFDIITASTAGTVMVIGDVTTLAAADTGGVIVIDGTLYGNGTSSTGATLAVGQIGRNNIVNRVTYNSGGKVETLNCTFVSSSDNTGGECNEGNVELPTDNTTTATVYVLQGYIPCCKWWDVACAVAPLIPSSHAASPTTTASTSTMMMMMIAATTTTIIMMNLLC